MTKEEKLLHFINNLNYNGFNFTKKQVYTISYIMNYYLEQISDYNITFNKEEIESDETKKIINKANFIPIADDNEFMNDFSVTTDNNIITINSDILNIKIINKENKVISLAKSAQGDIEYIQINDNNDCTLPNIHINKISESMENLLNRRYFGTNCCSIKTGKVYIIQQYENKTDNICVNKNYTKQVNYHDNSHDLYEYLDYTFEQYNYINNHENEFVKGKSKKKTKK